MTIEHVNTGKQYRTAFECSMDTGINQSTIQRILLGKYKSSRCGQVFRKIRPSKNKETKKVLHVETGRIYDDAKQVAECFGTSRENVYSCLIGKSKSCRGNHFQYVDE